MDRDGKRFLLDRIRGRQILKVIDGFLGRLREAVGILVHRNAEVAIELRGEFLEHLREADFQGSSVRHGEGGGDGEGSISRIHLHAIHGEVDRGAKSAALLERREIKSAREFIAFVMDDDGYRFCPGVIRHLMVEWDRS